jgi:hypothetical protein
MQHCLKVKNILVSSLSIDFLEVRWEIESTREDVLDYTFQVLRSEAPLGPFEEISTEMEDRYFFVDNRIKVANKYRQFHYKIRVKHKPSSDIVDFGPVMRDAEPDLIALEIRKHHNLLMREFVGRRCWILPARTFGQRCPACFNNTLKEKVRSGCRTCYDTGFVRGYHSPIESWIQFDPSPKANQQTNVGELQQTNTTARMGFFPPLKPRDVIIEPENRRWRVTQVNSTQRLRASIHQEIQLHEIPSTDVEYLIQFDLGTQTVKTANGDLVKSLSVGDLFLAGSRNFTNPQNLDNFEDEEIPDVFSLYPTTYPPVKS